jgi:hypothetical protein
MQPLEAQRRSVYPALAAHADQVQRLVVAAT